MKKYIFILAILFLPHFISLECVGTTFPVRTDGNTELIFISDSSVEARIREWAISRAKHSVDVVNLIVNADEGGLGFVQELRAAANRNVQVRITYDRTSSWADGDLWNDTTRLLADSSLKLPPKVIVMKDGQKKKMGVAGNDTLHEKIIVIDKGTPNELVFISGTNHHVFAHKTRDFGFVIRPVNPNKPYLGTDIAQHYEELWKYLEENFQVEKPRKMNTRHERMAHSKRSDFIIDNSQHQQLKSITDLLNSEPTPTTELNNFQFRPASVQFMSNDLLRQIATDKPGVNVEDRYHLNNDISDFVANLIRQSKEIHLQAYSIAPPPKIHEAIKDALAGGTAINLFTNGRKSHTLVPVGNPFVRGVSVLTGVFHAAFDYTLKQTIPLLEHGLDTQGRLNLYTLNGNKVTTLPGLNGARTFIHGKLLIGDDTVVFGSDNHTRASATKVQESVVAVHDPRMASNLREYLQRDLSLYDRVDLASAREDLRARGMVRGATSDLLCNLVLANIY